MYGVWQTARHYSTPGLQPWAIARSRSALAEWAEANIPRAGPNTRLFGAEKTGNQHNLTDADWTVVGFLHKDGFENLRDDPEIYTAHRRGNRTWTTSDSYDEPTEDDWAWQTVNLDIEEHKLGPQRPSDDVLYEFWEQFRAELRGRGIGDGHTNSLDASYFRFPGPAGLIPGLTAVVPGVRFRGRERPHSELQFDALSGDERLELEAAEPRLQELYGSSDLVHVQRSGEKKVRVEVIREGAPADRSQWPSYTEWFIASQHRLLHVLREFYGDKAAGRGEADPAVTASPVEMTGDEDAPDAKQIDRVPLRELNAEVVRVPFIAEHSAIPEEALFVKRFEQYLTARGHEVACYRVWLDGSYIETDISDVTAGVLYEAKASSGRKDVRMALGQVLDYGHHVCEKVPDIRLALLLPDMPPESLVGLLCKLEIGCVVEGPLGAFTEVTGRGFSVP